MDAKEISHTQSVDELSATLKAVGIPEVPQAPNTYPALNPVDIYRSHISELLAPLAGVDPKIVFNSLQWTNTLDKGDLVLAVPALRLKGKKPPEVAVELSQKVHTSSGYQRDTSLTWVVSGISIARATIRRRKLP